MTPFCARRVTVALAARIGLATLIPAQQLPDAPGTDKLHHVIAFAVLVLPMRFAKPHQFWKYVVYGIMFGIFIELAQPFVNRSGEVGDVLADGIGIILGCALGVGLRKLSGKSILDH
ncbi:VanZ family protein [Octadecabacter sp.]|nr:VanZ family protein [Octadecabacter sp.]